MNYFLERREGRAAKKCKRAGFSSSFLILPLAIVAVIGLILGGCDTGSGGDGGGGGGTTKNRSVEGVSLDRTSIILLVNGTDTLISTLNPVNASNKKVSWTSSDPATVEVTGGAIKGLKLGNATITITTADGGHSASCAVSVKAVKSIAVAGTAKYWYERDEEFDVSGLTLEVSYEDGVSSGGIPITSEMIKAPNHWNKGPGSRAITITYGGKSTDIAVMVREVTQVVLSGKLARTHYGVGEEFDPAGLYFTVIFNDGPNYGPKPVEASMLFPASWNATADPALNSCDIRYHGVPSAAFSATPSVLPASPYDTLGVYEVILRRPNMPPAGFRKLNDTDGALTQTPSATNTGNALGYTATITLYDSTLTLDAGLTQATGGTMETPFTNLTLEGFKTDRILKPSTTGGMFILKNGTKLTLGDHIILEEKDSADVSPLITVDDITDGSVFTMKSGSKLRTTTGTTKAQAKAGLGVLQVTKGKAVIEKGAEIIGGQIHVDLSASPTKYTAASAVLVEPEGTLIMNGGKISGDLTDTTGGGVGDVVVLGNLELGGDAHIGTLTLAADTASALLTGATFSKPVTINAGWAPPADYGVIKLNLSGNITADDGGVATATTVAKSNVRYFDGKALFKPGAGVTTDTMDKFALGDIFFNVAIFKEKTGTGTGSQYGRGDGTTPSTVTDTLTAPAHSSQYLKPMPGTLAADEGPTHYAVSSSVTGTNTKRGFNLKTPNVGQLNYQR